MSIANCKCVDRSPPLGRATDVGERAFSFGEIEKASPQSLWCSAGTLEGMVAQKK
jgi:hypothetical protein